MESSDDLSKMNDDQVVSHRRDLTERMQATSAALQRLRSEWAMVNEEVRSRGINHIEVTDHAVVRFLERVVGVDMDALRADIRKMHSESVPSRERDHRWHHSGHILVMRDDGSAVVTIIFPEQVSVPENGETTPFGEQLAQALEAK